ncbi:NUDIX hydrolase [Streptomyces millisiae]|uniref:NUDIX hydrolase n=1 Tax=Streptomyces millisiae TaxID=3075542 RepID=A0ABU2LWA2_9ACTN|nr:NUDIX hydrolase [Streptomyces sp. DSM 44918]MDT0321874.1 NUDIX hydrolase [Streptomyces sp. DSM 44918]
MLLRDTQDQITLVRPAGTKDVLSREWELPGATVRDGETPHETASRAIHRATGIRRDPPGALLVTEWRRADPLRARPAGVSLLFEPARLGLGELTPDPNVQFVAPEDIGRLATSLMERRVRAALAGQHFLPPPF